MDTVRLKVAYKSPESLMGELTRSVGRGGVRVDSKKALPVGTKFIFELSSPGIAEAVEVQGLVTAVNETEPGHFVLHIRYEPPAERRGIDGVIKRIFETSPFDKHRKSPRLPLHVRATEARANPYTYRVRDISMGGVGLDIDAPAVPPHITVGAPFHLHVKLQQGPLHLPGKVAWVMAPSMLDALPPQLGVNFVDLTAQSQTLLKDLLALKALPAPPWIARVTFE